MAPLPDHCGHVVNTGGLSREDSELSDYNLPWLFDHTRIDHLPIDEQVKYYKMPDLARTKAFKAGRNIFGDQIRKRIYMAEPMEKIDDPLHHHMNESVRITSKLNPQKRPKSPPTQAQINAVKQQEDIDEYKAWLKNRMEFRHNLENMGPSIESLHRKPDKTPLEKRVLKNMIKARYPTPPPKEMIVEKPLSPIMKDVNPVIKRPSPVAIGIIEQYLFEKKLRLIDLFTSVDRDKNWKLSRDEFRSAIKKAKIPISEVLLEDFILSLDTDMNNELDYRELAIGMDLWKKEKRETKHKMVSDTSNLNIRSISQLSGFETPDQQPDLVDQVMLLEADVIDKGIQEKKTRAKSAISTLSSSSSQYLETPEPDLRPEARIVDSEEAMVDNRKLEREVLKNYNKKRQGSSSGSRSKTPSSCRSHYSSMTPIKTGDKAVDDHNQPSTLRGNASDLLKQFRQMQLQEYHKIITLCKEHNVVMSKKLLDKAILYNQDKNSKELKKEIRQPADLPSSIELAQLAINGSLGGTLLGSHDHRRQVIKSSQRHLLERTAILEQKYMKGKKPPNIRKLHDDKSSSKSATKASNMSDELSELEMRAIVRQRPKPQKMSHSARGKKLYAMEHTNASEKIYLSTGKAYVASKTDCWLTFPEYQSLIGNYAGNMTKLHPPVDPNAFWPGQLIDKIRLIMPNKQPKPNAMFQRVHKEFQRSGAPL